MPFQEFSDREIIDVLDGDLAHEDDWITQVDLQNDSLAGILLANDSLAGTLLTLDYIACRPRAWPTPRLRMRTF